MAKPKFMQYVTDEKEGKYLMTLYNALPKRQKVKWRKSMHRAHKANQTNGE